MRSLIAAVLHPRLVILVISAILLGFGFNAARNLSVDAFPDVTNVQVQIATEAPGKSPEEVERFVTVPIEVAMNSVQKKSTLRSISMFGLSVTKIIFDDDVEDFFARQQVNNLL